MQIQILGTESLGVRGLSCVVRTADRKIVFDPGLALGYRRGGLLPHPIQVARGEEVRSSIIAALADATDVVISHFHGDHMPLPDANPYQLQARRVARLFGSVRLWTKGTAGDSAHIKQRAKSFSAIIGRDLPDVERQNIGPFTFSPALPHGERNSRLGTVMMTRLQDENEVFVHASDIQLLNDEAVIQVLRWEPTVLLVSGPPIYLHLSRGQERSAWRRAGALASQVKICIIDHHLLRCMEGISWLKRLSVSAGHKVFCAADFMNRPRRLLEASRQKLYRRFPVPPGWHEAYGRGLVDTVAFRRK